MKQLTIYLNHCLNNCKKCARDERRTFFDQAYGAMMMFCLMQPSYEKQAVALWEENYRPQFEEAVFCD